MRSFGLPSSRIVHFCVRGPRSSSGCGICRTLALLCRSLTYTAESGYLLSTRFKLVARCETVRFAAMRRRRSFGRRRALSSGARRHSRLCAGPRGRRGTGGGWRRETEPPASRGGGHFYGSHGAGRQRAYEAGLRRLRRGRNYCVFGWASSTVGWRYALAWPQRRIGHPEDSPPRRDGDLRGRRRRGTHGHCGYARGLGISAAP